MIALLPDFKLTEEPTQDELMWPVNFLTQIGYHRKIFRYTKTFQLRRYIRRGGFVFRCYVN